MCCACNAQLPFRATRRERPVHQRGVEGAARPLKIPKFYYFYFPRNFRDLKWQQGVAESGVKCGVAHRETEREHYCCNQFVFSGGLGVSNDQGLAANWG